MKTLYKLISVLLLLAMLLAACGGGTTTDEGDMAGEETTGEETVAEEEMAENPLDYLNADREDTLIVDKPGRLQGGDNWNPKVPGNAVGWGMAQLGFESLMILNYETGEMMPWLAESFEGNSESTEFTLKLRDGITFYDGTPMTIDDIIYTFELEMATEGFGGHFTWKEWIASIEKVDDLTATFKLAKPNPRFVLDYFSVKIAGTTLFLPKHVWETVEDPMTFKNFDIAKMYPMATGPYMLGKVSENEVFLVRNDNWWGYKTGFQKLPEPKLVIISYVGTEEVRTATAIDNGFDVMEDITFGAWQAIQAQNPKWEAYYDDFPYAVPDPCARLIGLNNAVEPWNDKEMRQMLNHVMDRQQIIDIAYEGTTTLAPTFWPSYASMQPYTDLIPKDKWEAMLTPDLDKATEILESKGYVKTGDYWTKDGVELSLEIQCAESFSELERIADVFAEQLQRFGINAVKVKLVDGTFYDNSNFGNYEANSQWFTCGSVNEPWATLRTMSGEGAPIGETPQGQQNVYRWYNERYTEIVNEIGVLPLGDPKIMELTAEALEILYDELPALPAAQAKKLIPNNFTYWTNFPSAKNPYISPWCWWTSFVVVVVNLEKATN
ncbi:MAG: ABC transporter substrate-binding protein [Anaerolineae bacterium]|nr:ABC transporter substrate-binding protein [Anaerolineae bacterium]